jgi:hypothetical protein
MNDFEEFNADLEDDDLDDVTDFNIGELKDKLQPIRWIRFVK